VPEASSVDGNAAMNAESWSEASDDCFLERLRREGEEMLWRAVRETTATQLPGRAPADRKLWRSMLTRLPKTSGVRQNRQYRTVWKLHRLANQLFASNRRPRKPSGCGFLVRRGTPAIGAV